MSTLAQLEARVAARLVDSGNAVFAIATLDEALRAALSDYSEACPLAGETYITLPAAGREIALSGLSGLTHLLNVWWPFDPDAEVWPANQVSGWRLWWDDGQPVLFLSSAAGRQPQANDNVRVWYTQAQAIQNLDGAAATTVFAQHESGLVLGAAAYAALSEGLNQIGMLRLDPGAVPALQAWGNARLEQFRAWLNQVRLSAPAGGEPYGAGWGLDKWDAQRAGRGAGQSWR